MIIPYLSLTILATVIILGTWWLIRKESPPRWLIFLITGAALLRLALGIFWSVAMPRWGHNTPAEQRGYIMADASKRDQAAWDLARSNKPLWTAFRGNRAADQYGGMLFLSAIIYRYLGGQTHQPLLIVILTAAVSSLAVLFTWLLARRAWDERIAGLAAWALALYPEAVLLGSSQMREAFTVTLTATAFYGLLRYRDDRSWISLVWMLAPIALYLPFSPPFAALLVSMLAIAALGITQRKQDLFKQRRFWFILAGLVILIIIGLWITLSQFTPEKITNPLGMLSWWLRKSVEYQAHLAERASGWMQVILDTTPEWSHLPMIVLYGVLQPFLPAALTVGSHAPIWPSIVLWRATGWTVLLVLLIYAPILAFRSRRATGFTKALSIIVWLVILISSLRGGGDMWDNPRYRSSYASLEIGLAAWAFIEYRRAADPWFRRALLGFTGAIAWFLPWYLDRYTAFDWPLKDPLVIAGLGVASGSMLILWDIARTKQQQDKNPPSIDERNASDE